jgi:uncharacterized coiled-coil protein SlyX
MSRRRTNSDQDDSLDLLLDTVTNVFGGVMFLTLLAALLVLSGGRAAVVEPEIDTPAVDDQVLAKLVAVETRQTASALRAQQKTLARLDPDGSIAAKADRLKSIRETLTVARRQQRRAGSAVENRQQELEDRQANQSDLEDQIAELQQAVTEKSEQVNQIRAESERTVLFRPLSLSRSKEAVVILRYGRWYLLYEQARGGRVNREDFFILESDDAVTTITPKPHRGHPVSDASLGQLVQHLKRNFPTRQFHITIAVWDDSFAEFNPLKDALTESGYQYRTLTCDISSRLSNQGAVDPFVQ